MNVFPALNTQMIGELSIRGFNGWIRVELKMLNDPMQIVQPTLF